MSNNDQQNRVRGPTSALSSFLREHGIRVENRSRRERREDLARQQAEEASNEETPDTVQDTVTTTVDTPSTTVEAPHQEEETTAVLYAPRTRRTLAAANRALVEAANEKANNGKKKPEDDKPDPGIGSSFRAPKGRTRIFFCSKCNKRFARIASLVDVGDENICPSCLDNNGPKEPPKPKKRKIGSKRQSQNKAGFNDVPSLQDICTDTIAEHIDCVEALGDISTINMDKIATIISRNRKMDTRTAQLFMNPLRRELTLTDCTAIDKNGLINIAQFCPHLEKLTLTYCGRMTDEVINAYATRLKNLKSIELSGPYLVTDKGWESFFGAIGSQLNTFAIRHSMRFTQASMKALVGAAKNLKHLRLSRLSRLDDDGVELICRLKPLETLEISWPGCKISSSILAKILEHHTTLKELCLDGCTSVDDTVVEAIQLYCPHLEKLSLSECNEITSEAIQTLFEEWKTPYPGRGLTYLNISRCLSTQDEALIAIINHSKNTLKHLNIHSLDDLTPLVLERLGVCKELTTLDCGFVRSMDDCVMGCLAIECPKLKDIEVWGCHQITSTMS
ncbi:hypothetical protein F4703DRAFT_1893939 [Phycomyces blakesleeanus]|uniref:RNI-like protein n=1 Tax=Phycomyces blakesleeanus (strain ATCC 8743b / DSM 1359 / FGSC 10004 / NBRC 33097 / NRRL 1555) TaxID=763407 RepID=A0A167NGF0_PHYB8|nr:hypothetical protein PHYBLDRAFT_180430 [Phycomyces blakesleeanus NRRL 1555(-)]OAD75844.1 hypothetical protein PHYBLDRAFT_180430 [Phycomyces blakesleeanus NRRL 1555(-)]|eukprot:XP_018293884.1 hypothetical protein PHYBLDRAFT_180430 [Phycomyces blakesleeanus NRRL 1555(-)]